MESQEKVVRSKPMVVQLMTDTGCELHYYAGCYRPIVWTGTVATNTNRSVRLPRCPSLNHLPSPDPPSSQDRVWLRKVGSGCGQLRYSLTSHAKDLCYLGGTKQMAHRLEGTR